MDCCHALLLHCMRGVFANTVDGTTGTVPGTWLTLCRLGVSSYTYLLSTFASPAPVPKEPSTFLVMTQFD